MLPYLIRLLQGFINTSKALWASWLSKEHRSFFLPTLWRVVTARPGTLSPWTRWCRHEGHCWGRHQKEGATWGSNSYCSCQEDVQEQNLTSLEGQVKMYHHINRQNVSLKILKLIPLIGKYTVPSLLCVASDTTVTIVTVYFYQIIK